MKEENSDEFYDFSSQGEKRRVRGSRNAKMHRNGQGGDVGVGGCRTTLFGVCGGPKAGSRGLWPLP